MSLLPHQLELLAPARDYPARHGAILLPFDAAMNHAVRIHNQDVADFLTLAARLPKFGRTIDAQLARYVNGLRTWMRANYEFSRTAARYRVT